jgi:hypothetical protein
MSDRNSRRQPRYGPGYAALASMAIIHLRNLGPSAVSNVSGSNCMVLFPKPNDVVAQDRCPTMPKQSVMHKDASAPHVTHDQVGHHLHHFEHKVKDRHTQPSPRSFGRTGLGVSNGDRLTFWPTSICYRDRAAANPLFCRSRSIEQPH